MFALEFALLTGRYVATCYSDRRKAEWPPHPARVFSALVATAFESERPDPAELDALRWLEALDPPRVHASESSARDTVTVFVPVNDVTVTRDKPSSPRKKEPSKGEIKAGTKVLPDGRTRQPRTFPSVTPDDPRFRLSWPDAPDAEHHEVLDRIARRVVRIGHSASLVAGRVVTDPGEPTWVPHDGGDQLLRITRAGQLERLQQAFGQHQATEPRVLPADFQAYARAQDTAERPDMKATVFGPDWIVLRRLSGSNLPITATVGLATAVRGALMRHADQPPAEMLSGHEPGGRPSQRPHLAIVPLPSVGHRHADGHLLGVALVMPRDATMAERQSVFRAVGRWEESCRADDEAQPRLRVVLGKAGDLDLERLVWSRPLKSLRPGLWSRPARSWVSVTPIALDRNPGQLRHPDPDRARAAHDAAAATIATACTHVGLPEPVRVEIHPSVPIPGSQKARRFPAYPQGPGKFRRVLVHARIEFEEPVRGPILLGAGRYLGLGLLRPVLPPRRDT